MKESDKDLLREWLTAAASAMILIILLLLMAAMGGCTRRVYVPLESNATHTDTMVQTRWLTDIQADKDSVFVLIKGDSVYVDRIKWRTRYVNRGDTVYIAKTDTVTKEIPVEVEKRVEVERKLTWWEKTRLNTWGWLMAALLLCFGWLYRKPLLSLVRRLLTKTT